MKYDTINVCNSSNNENSAKCSLLKLKLYEGRNTLEESKVLHHLRKKKVAELSEMGNLTLRNFHSGCATALSII